MGTPGLASENTGLLEWFSRYSSLTSTQSSGCCVRAYVTPSGRRSGMRRERWTIGAMVNECSVCATPVRAAGRDVRRSEEHTSELQSRENLVCRLLLEKKKTKYF